jgi:putative serine protease PepD
VHEDDLGASGRDPHDDGGGEEPEGGGLRGWIPPDDRLWRHPSESGGSAPLSSVPPPALDRTTGGMRTGPWVIGGTAACLVAVLVVAGLIMVNANTGSSPSATTGQETLVGEPTTEPGLDSTVSGNIDAMVDSIRPSTVVLKVRGPHGVSSTTGLVAEAGGIIVTAARALAGARSITVIEPDGTHQAAQLVGVDQPSGLGVVRIDDDLPAATFDDGDPSVGAIAVAAALEPGSTRHPTPSSLAYAGKVVSIGQALDADAATTTFSATAVRAPLDRDDLGCALLDDSGHVSGMLETIQGEGASTTADFLPAELVLGVTLQLVTSGTVDHGWMGMEVSDADDAAPPSDGDVVTSTSAVDGARVDLIDANGPAAYAGLAAGDVITAVDGYQVLSTAELRTRLYADPPGMDLTVTYERGGNTYNTSMVLAQPGGDAPAGGS